MVLERERNPNDNNYLIDIIWTVEVNDEQKWTQTDFAAKHGVDPSAS